MCVGGCNLESFFFLSYCLRKGRVTLTLYNPLKTFFLSLSFLPCLIIVYYPQSVSKIIFERVFTPYTYRYIQRSFFIFLSNVYIITWQDEKIDFISNPIISIIFSIIPVVRVLQFFKIYGCVDGRGGDCFILMWIFSFWVDNFKYNEYNRVRVPVPIFL